jgi:hypothetical protein
MRASTLFAALALTTAPLAPLRAQAPDPAAEITFWNSIKDSKSPAEIKAYLDRYPTGTFSELAKIRLKALEAPAAAPVTAAPAAPAAPPPPASAAAASRTPAPVPPPASGASALTSPAVIQEVANRLYNLNYTINPQARTIDEEYRNAVRRWQTVTKRPLTGDMTEADVAYLRTAAAPTTWGAIGYNVSGGASTVWNRPGRANAEADALKGCGDLNGGACKSLAAANAACGALAYSSGTANGRQYRDAYAAVEPSLGLAIERALSNCRGNARIPNNCAVRTTFCANGSHKQ